LSSSVSVKDRALGAIAHTSLSQRNSEYIHVHHGISLIRLLRNDKSAIVKATTDP
jgi:hypothetical protein